MLSYTRRVYNVVKFINTRMYKKAGSGFLNKSCMVHSFHRFYEKTCYFNITTLCCTFKIASQIGLYVCIIFCVLISEKPHYKY